MYSKCTKSKTHMVFNNQQHSTKKCNSRIINDGRDPRLRAYSDRRVPQNVVIKNTNNVITPLFRDFDNIYDFQNTCAPVHINNTSTARSIDNNTFTNNIFTNVISSTSINKSTTINYNESSRNGSLNDRTSNKRCGIVDGNSSYFRNGDISRNNIINGNANTSRSGIINENTNTGRNNDINGYNNTSVYNNTNRSNVTNGNTNTSRSNEIKDNKNKNNSSNSNLNSSVNDNINFNRNTTVYNNNTYPANSNIDRSINNRSTSNLVIDNKDDLKRISVNNNSTSRDSNFKIFDLLDYNQINEFLYGSKQEVTPPEAIPTYFKNIKKHDQYKPVNSHQCHVLSGIEPIARKEELCDKIENCLIPDSENVNSADHIVYIKGIPYIQTKSSFPGNRYIYMNPLELQLNTFLNS